MKKPRRKKLVRPVLRSFDCTDHDPIDEWQPDGRPVWYYLALHIGPPDSEARDLHYVLVADRDGLAELKQSGYRPGPEPPIVVEPYSWEGVMEEISRRLVACEDWDWLGVQEKLRKQFRWEYEDYARRSERIVEQLRELEGRG